MSDFERFEAQSLAADYGVGGVNNLAPVRSIETITEEILFYKSQAGLAILEIGKRLIEAKEQLRHGEWENWLEEKVDFSARTARRFMQIAENYDKTDTGVLSLGVRKALALLALPDSEREDFVSEKHDVDGVEKTVVEMTSEELERAIRERDDAENARKTAERKAEDLSDTLQVVQAKLDAAEVEAKQNADHLAAAKERESKAKERAARLEKELKELREKPVDVAVEKVVDTEAVEAARKEAEQAAEKALREKEQALELAKAQLDAATAAADSLRAAEQEAIEKAEALRKQLLTADPAVAEFKLLFEQWQKTFREMNERLVAISRNDAEKGARLRAAVRAAAEPMRA